MVSNNTVNPGPFFFPVNENDTPIKQPHDQYDIYVNNNYVGKKVLLTENDSVEDVNDFLKKNGFEQYSAELAGDHYNISLNDAEQAKSMREYLNTYLQIR